jgi:hypothetical protein
MKTSTAVSANPATSTSCARFTLNVETPHGTLTFACLCHRTENPSERLIEQDFYETDTHSGVPQGTHHEMELLPGPWKRPGLPRTHYHANQTNGKEFLCWTGHLPKIELAMVVFERWCLGTTYTNETGKDFVPYAQKFAHNWDLVALNMQKDFGIKLAGDVKVTE